VNLKLFTFMFPSILWILDYFNISYLQTLKFKIQANSKVPQLITSQSISLILAKLSIPYKIATWQNVFFETSNSGS